MRCQSSARHCGGYPDLGRSILPTGAFVGWHERSLLLEQNQAQLVAHFLGDYLPPEGSVPTRHQSPVYWAELFPTFLHSQSPVIKASLSALTLIHLAKSRHDDALAHRSRQHYRQAVQQICALKGKDDPSHLIRTAMILALYELYAQPPGQGHAWNVHVTAACNLAREHRAAMLNNQDRQRLRTIEFLRKCVNVSDGVSAVNRSPMGLSTDRFDLLLDILSEIGQLRSGLRHQIARNGVTWDSTACLLMTSACLENQLLSWYHKWQSETNHPLFTIRSTTVPPAAMHPRQPEETMFFTDPSGIPHLLLYWLGLVLLYATVAETLRGLTSEQVRSRTIQQRLTKADALCHHFATRLAQCQSGCTGKGTGTAILAAAAWQAAQSVRAVS
ncbi:uncharacterized protein BO80DRAFT_123769 [Aspergillus ibericus CBS 121593]|uniref:Transcription factor domain-containing protein n=1 Tax=Aspergillus ibericus CBS 121593 TaxID=1448316 RepID=A0A395GV45_9EURO|nr:hypothetical protein BO80DRAFT_123769 [Aspergillus ibericus CBS 121593]RAK99430.1 hypothetical protein BO80DRAFT_123769 [Aspergillus ibericus CBS 121593]